MGTLRGTDHVTRQPCRDCSLLWVLLLYLQKTVLQPVLVTEETETAAAPGPCLLVVLHK